MDLGFGVWGLGFRFWGLGSRVQGSVLRGSSRLTSIENLRSCPRLVTVG